MLMNRSTPHITNSFQVWLSLLCTVYISCSFLDYCSFGVHQKRRNVFHSASLRDWDLMRALVVEAVCWNLAGIDKGEKKRCQFFSYPLILWGAEKWSNFSKSMDYRAHAPWPTALKGPWTWASLWRGCCNYWKESKMVDKTMSKKTRKWKWMTFLKSAKQAMRCQLWTQNVNKSHLNLLFSEHVLFWNSNWIRDIWPNLLSFWLSLWNDSLLWACLLSLLHIYLIYIHSKTKMLVVIGLSTQHS